MFVKIVKTKNENAIEEKNEVIQTPGVKGWTKIWIEGISSTPAQEKNWKPGEKVAAINLKNFRINFVFFCFH